MPPVDVTSKEYLTLMELKKMKEAFIEQCSAGDLERIQAFVNSKRPDKKSLTDGLVATIRYKKHDVSSFLLQKGAIISPEVVIAAYVRNKSVEIFQLLLDHGWDINAPNLQNGPVLLHIIPHEEVVEWFFNHGAKLDHSMSFPPDEDYCRDLDATCLYLNRAACMSTKRIFDIFLAHGAARADSIPLHTAASVPNNEEMMAHLIDVGFDVNGTDDHTKKHPCWGTPLVYAVQSNLIGNVKYLLSKGADPLKPKDLTPLELAKRMELTDIVAILSDSKP